MKRTLPPLWLLLGPLDDPAIPALAPSLAWMARDCGVAFEGYFEANRTGALFARTGSTVHGGAHHLAFNCASLLASRSMLPKTDNLL